MAYASSRITGSYLGNLVAEAYTLIFRKQAGGRESETGIRNTFTFLISLQVLCYSYFKSLGGSLPVSCNEQKLCWVCSALLNACMRRKKVVS